MNMRHTIRRSSGLHQRDGDRSKTLEDVDASTVVTVVVLANGVVPIRVWIYLDLALIFLRLRFSLRILFLRHLALIVDHKCEQTEIEKSQISKSLKL
jgi:hypothetical protein